MAVAPLGSVICLRIGLSLRVAFKGLALGGLVLDNACRPLPRDFGQKAPWAWLPTAPSGSCQVRFLRLGHSLPRAHRPCREQFGRRPLPCLNAFQVAGQIADSELLVLDVGLVHVTKNRSPHRHRRRAVRRHFGAKLQHRSDMRVGELSVVVLLQSVKSVGWDFSADAAGPRPLPSTPWHGAQ